LPGRRVNKHMAEKNDNVVVVKRLTKVFRDFWLREKVTAVADLDLEIHSKEVFGLLGPNGSGKSTTLKMILGLLFPTRGRISVFGKRPTDVRTKARIGFLPEESYLYPFLNAVETLDFYGRLFHQSRQIRRSRIDMLLDMVGLTGVAYRRVGEYSKGMQRRIGLAQALINDPDLLILDEPTAGMDPIGTRQIKDLICTLARRGKTVLLSSHLLADVEDVCDRVCILYGGRQRRLGSIDELLARRTQTQITIDDLDDTTLRKIQRLLDETGKDVDITTPRDRLEGLFLSIVREAREKKLATGGSISGGKVAEFLRAETPAGGEKVIRELVTAAVEPEELEPPTEKPTEQLLRQVEEPAKEVIEELTSQRKPAPVQEDHAPPEPAEIREVEADRNIIEGLMGGSDSKPEDS